MEPAASCLLCCFMSPGGPACTPPGMIPLALILTQFRLNPVFKEKRARKSLNSPFCSEPRACTHFPGTAQSSGYYFVLNKINSLYRK